MTKLNNTKNNLSFYFIKKPSDNISDSIKNKIIKISKYNKDISGKYKYGNNTLNNWNTGEISCLISLENRFNKIINHFKTEEYKNGYDFLTSFFEKIKELKPKKIYNLSFSDYSNFSKLPLEQQFYILFHNGGKNSFGGDCNYSNIFYKNLFDKIGIKSKIAIFSSLENTNHTELLVNILGNYFMINLFNGGYGNIYKRLNIGANVSSYNYQLMKIKDNYLKTDNGNIILENNFDNLQKNQRIEIFFKENDYTNKSIKLNYSFEVGKIYIELDGYDRNIDFSNLENIIKSIKEKGGMQTFFKNLTHSNDYKKLIGKINKKYFIKYLEKLLIEYKEFSKK